ncbi:MAG: glycosyltransferase family 39 protein [Candidatus Thermoplasmatota archaeon]|nr:glycosyltransferase family 39 protein [Candidatus Thermoplasmatota archaeon]
MKAKAIIYDYRFLLAAIVAIAIFLRSFPAWLNPAWGVDYGIYYGITVKLADDPQFYQPHTGWGSSYEYFPVLYVITLAFHWITGASISFLLPKVAPVFGGLTVLILYFMALELFKSKRVALISAALLAVSTIQIYETSHAAPLTMGHFFLLLSLYFFIKYRNNESYTGPLYVSTMLLIASHHLSTYFYIISICAITIIRNWNVETWRPKIKTDVFYIIFASATTFIYWGFVATPVFRSFIGGATGLSPALIISLFYATLFACLLACKVKMAKYYHVPKVKPSMNFNWAMLGITFGGTLALIFIIKVIGAFGGARVNWPTMIFVVPLCSALVGFAAIGWSYLHFYKNGRFIKGWIIAILVSMLYSVVTSNGYLYIERHLEYIIEPMCIAAAAGFLGFIARFEYSKRRITVGLLACLIAAMAIGYPQYVSNAWQYPEDITESNVNAVDWMEASLPDGSTIATDHRMGVYLEANTTKNFKATFEKGIGLWNSTDWRECIGALEYNETEISGGQAYNFTRRVTYFLVDDLMYESGVNINLYSTSGSLIMIENTTYAMLNNESQPFHLVHRNCTYKWLNETALLETYNKSQGGIDFLDLEDEELMKHVGNWCEIYAVDWNFIESNRESGATP